MNPGMFSSNSMEWSTPQWLFDLLDAQFHFDIDLAASPENAKCERYYTINDDALSQKWEGVVAFLNPPYGRQIGLWTRKALESSQEHNSTIVMLVPARTDTLWWWRHCGQAEVRFLPGRIKFEMAGVPLAPAPFPSAIVVFRPGAIQGTMCLWDVRNRG